MRECGVHFLDRVAIRYRVGSPSLMHSRNPTEAQKLGESLGHKQMQMKYRKAYGALEFYALALFTRTILKIFLTPILPGIAHQRAGRWWLQWTKWLAPYRFLIVAVRQNMPAAGSILRFVPLSK